MKIVAYTFLLLLWGTHLCSMTLIQTQTVSSATSVIFPVTTVYNNYVLYATNVSAYTLNDTASMVVQLSTDGGRSFITTGYLLAGRIAKTGFPLNIGYSSTDMIATFNSHLLNLTSGSGVIFFINSGALMSPSTSLFSYPASNSCYTGQAIIPNALQVVWDDGQTLLSGTFSLYGIVD